MTPLMRAVQRNSMNCVEYLLSETQSDLNGKLNILLLKRFTVAVSLGIPEDLALSTGGRLIFKCK